MLFCIFMKYKDVFLRYDWKKQKQKALFMMINMDMFLCCNTPLPADWDNYVRSNKRGKEKRQGGGIHYSMFT